MCRLGATIRGRSTQKTASLLNVTVFSAFASYISLMGFGPVLSYPNPDGLGLSSADGYRRPTQAHPATGMKSVSFSHGLARCPPVQLGAKRGYDPERRLQKIMQ